jgi:hypothetical protein
MNTVPNPNSI